MSMDYFFGLWLLVALSMLIAGAVFWADGQTALSITCDLNKKANETLGVYTPEEIESLYNACKAHAHAEIRWSQPVTIVGTILLLLGIGVQMLMKHTKKTPVK